MRIQDVPGGVRCRLAVPSRDGSRVVVFDAVAGVPDEVGGKFIRKLRGRARKAAGRLAKSRVAKAVADAGPTVARFLPGPAGAALSAASATLRGAQNIERWRRGDFGQEKAVLGVLSGNPKAALALAREKAKGYGVKLKGGGVKLMQRAQRPVRSASKKGVVVTTKSGRRALVTWL
jgi:hypothetical protein